MGIYKRIDSPFYWMKFKVIGPKDDVISVIKSTGYTDKKLAQDAYEDERNAALKGQRFGKKSTVLVPEIIDDYLKKCRNQASYQGKRAQLAHVREHFEKWRAAAVTAEECVVYQQKRLQELGKEKSKQTINRELSYFRRAFKVAILSGKYGLTENPVKSSKDGILKFFSEKKFRRDRFLTVDEKPVLLPEIAKIEGYGPYLLKMVIFAFQTGLRQGEQLDLKWTDILFNQKKIRVLAGDEDKTRFVPMFGETEAILRSLPRRGEYVFSDENGRKLSRWGFVTCGFALACKRAGIKNLRWHDLRHTFASDLLMAGVDIKTVGEYMGHSLLTMTERYSHLLPSYKAAQINLLPSAFRYVQVTLEKDGNGKTSKKVDYQSRAGDGTGRHASLRSDEAPTENSVSPMES